MKRTHNEIRLTAEEKERVDDLMDCLMAKPPASFVADVERLLLCCAAGDLKNVIVLRNRLSNVVVGKVRFRLSQADTKKCFSRAAKAGKLEVFKWLYTNPEYGGTYFQRSLDYTFLALNTAVKHGCLECLEWLSTQPGTTFAFNDESSLRWAIRRGRISVVEWWWHKHMKGHCKVFRRELYDVSKGLFRRNTSRDYEMLDWLFQHDQLKITAEAFIEASRQRGNDKDEMVMLTWLWDHANQAQVSRQFKESKHSEAYWLKVGAANAVARKEVAVWIQNRGFDYNAVFKGWNK